MSFVSQHCVEMEREEDKKNPSPPGPLSLLPPGFIPRPPDLLNLRHLATPFGFRHGIFQIAARWSVNGSTPRGNSGRGCVLLVVLRTVDAVETSSNIV